MCAREDKNRHIKKKGIFAVSNKAYLEEIRLVWDIVYDSFRNSMTDAIRELWFKDLTIEDYEGGVITRGIKSELKQKTLTEKYTGELARRFSDELGFDVIVNVVFTGTPLNKEEMLINFSQLQTHCNEVITTLKQHSEIKDTQTLRKSELKALLTESNDVQYGSSHLDICLLFLEKTKRIKMFNVKVENVEIECVKILNDKNGYNVF